MIIAAILIVSTGCAPKLDWYETSFNSPGDIFTQPLKKGMSELEVLQQLGTPSFQAQLTKNRKIARYYAERIVWEDHEFADSLNERDRYHIDIWYTKGKVVKSAQHHLSSRKLKGPSEPFTSFSMEDRTLYHPLTSTEYNLGLPYDHKQATSITNGTMLSELLWTLGAPNRILSSAQGEVFVYEHGGFSTQPEAENSLKFESYDYRKDYFIIRDATVVQQQHFTINFDLSPPNDEDHDAALYLSMAFNHYINPQAWLDYCLEYTEDETITCDPEVLRIEGEYPKLKQLFYYIQDLDLAFIKQDRQSLFSSVLEMTEENLNNDTLNLLLIYRSAIPSSMLVGRANQKDIFASQHLRPYYEKLQSDQGKLARTWVNFNQPDKWYFNSKGQLVAGVHLSLTSPPSPWYAFGPMAFDIGFDRRAGGACTIFSSNCLKPLEQIYKDSIVIPEL
jgi:hypothetical protein